MESGPRRTRLFTILGGAAAAATAAFVASRLGVAGTIVGAAVASIVASIGAEVYDQAVHRSAAAMTALAVRGRVVATGADDPAEPDGDAGVDVLAADSPSSGEGGLEPEGEAVVSGGRFSWRHVVLVAVGVFFVVLAAITAVELIIGKPISALWGGDQTTGTSVGGAIRPRPAATTPAATSGSSPTTAPSPSTSTTVPVTPPPNPGPTPTVTVTITSPATPPGGQPTPSPGVTP